MASHILDVPDQLREHPADAIVLDLMLPVIDGWMFLNAMDDLLAQVECPLSEIPSRPR